MKLLKFKQISDIQKNCDNQWVIEEYNHEKQ